MMQRPACACPPAFQPTYHKACLLSPCPASPARPLPAVQSRLEGLSLYSSVHWPGRSNGGIGMYDWVAGCTKLSR